MNVLSLFDGMSCGQIALDKLGIKPTNYFASEIDKFAIQVAKKNFPNTIHLGDVTKLQTSGDHLLDEFECGHKIDLLIGGSPCQGFSYANTSKDKKKLAFDHPQSQLFFEFIRLVEETKPTFVFLENVRMKTEWRDEITNILSEVRGYRIEPVLWDSALVSAQRRLRNYWTDIPGFVIPEDRGILLKDVLEDEVDESNLLSNKAKAYMDRTVKGGRNHWDFKHHSESDNDKSQTVVANFHKGVPYNVLIDKRELPETKDCSEYSPVKKKNYVQFDKSGKGFNSQQDRYFFRDNKSGTVSTKGNGNVEVK